MTLLAGAFVVLAAFVTATVSGVLGLAGGLLLLGALLLVLPVAVAFVVHGLLQLVSNGWRAFLQRAHIAWRSVAWYAAPRRAVPYAVLLLAVPLSMLGTALGGRLLDRMSEASFTSWTRWVMTAIGGVYLVQVAVLASV